MQRSVGTTTRNRCADASTETSPLWPWASQVWYRDPRFSKYLPKGNATVCVIATSGTTVDRLALLDRLVGLEAAIDTQGALTLTDAVAEYVELITGQHGVRLEVLLARGCTRLLLIRSRSCRCEGCGRSPLG